MADRPLPESDIREDAWERFEKAVDVALHTKPMHRESKPAKGDRKPKRESKS